MASVTGWSPAMTRSRSLRSRIVFAFTVFAGVVACSFAGIAFGVFHATEDAVVERLLESEVARVTRHHESQGTLPPPTPFVTSYLGEDELPPALRGAIARLPPGRHELDDDDREVFVSIAEGARGSRLIVVHQTKDASLGVPHTLAIGLGALAIFAAGTLLGLYTAGRIVRPLSQLSELVQRTPPEQLADVLAARPTEEEVGVLSARLEHSLRSLEAFADREQRFTRYASHELRTPVAVVKGAAELLRAAPEAGARHVDRPLSRIERATAEMEAIIESLLWLAREREVAEPSTPTAVAPIVLRVVERHRHLLSGKDVVVSVEPGDDIAVCAPPAVIEMVVGNLVQNACHFTNHGTIAIAAREGAVTVSDTGPGMTETQRAGSTRAFARGEDSAGYGLGLSIVSSLCERFDWRLDIESTLGKGTRAKVTFVPTAASDSG